MAAPTRVRYGRPTSSEVLIHEYDHMAPGFWRERHETIFYTSLDPATREVAHRYWAFYLNTPGGLLGPFRSYTTFPHGSQPDDHPEEQYGDVLPGSLPYDFGMEELIIAMQVSGLTDAGSSPQTEQYLPRHPDEYHPEHVTPRLDTQIPYYPEVKIEPPDAPPAPPASPPVVCGLSSYVMPEDWREEADRAITRLMAYTQGWEPQPTPLQEPVLAAVEPVPVVAEPEPETESSSLPDQTVWTTAQEGFETADSGSLDTYEYEAAAAYRSSDEDWEPSESQSSCTSGYTS